MNKNIIKIAVAAMTCVTLCEVTLAGPAHGGGRKPAPAPAHQMAPAQHHQGRHKVKGPAHHKWHHAKPWWRLQEPPPPPKPPHGEPHRR